MESDIGRWLRGWAARIYPERQFLYRADGVVRVVALGRKSQMALTLAALILLGWMTFTTAEVVMRDQILEAKDQRIAEITKAYSVLETQADKAEQRFLAITEKLEIQHQHLVELMSYQAKIDSELTSVRGALDLTTLERDEAQLLNKELNQRLEKLQSDVSTVGVNNRTLAESLADAENEISNLVAQRNRAQQSQRKLTSEVAGLTDALRVSNGIQGRLSNDLGTTRGQLAAITEQRNATTEQNKALDSQIGQLTERLDASNRRNSALINNLAEAEEQVANLIFERDEAVLSRDFLSQLVGELEYRLSDLKNAQGDLILHLHERARESATSLEQVVAMTGLPIGDLLEMFPPAPDKVQGGPESRAWRVVDTSLISNNQAEFLEAVNTVEIELDRWRTLQEVVAVLPLIPPSDNYYVSSYFGQRLDPFTRRPAMHYGIDLAGPFDSHLRTPAPGVVTRAGYWGAYGRMVEIDHGHGIVTRYGHMNRIQVEEGQMLAFRDQIGTMGRSGRATGSHVHYEVLFNGEPLDPANFLKAGRYVFKDRQTQPDGG